MRHLQYYYIFAFVVFFLNKIIVLINADYNEDNENDIEIFASLLNKIPTWEQTETQFNNNEITQIITKGAQSLGDVELNDKYETKITAIKCSYGYAVQNILLNLKLMSDYNKSTQSHDNEIHIVDDHSGTCETVEPPKKKVRFNEDVKLLAVDKNDPVRFSEVLKKTPIDLKNNMGYRTQNANDIVQNQLLNREYIIELNKEKRCDSPNFTLSHYRVYVEGYRELVNRMLSVLYMAKRVAASWLWRVSIVLGAIDRLQLKLETLWIRDDVHTAVDDFVVGCTANKYLERAPPNQVRGSGNDFDNLLDSLSQSAVLFGYLLAETTSLFKYQDDMAVYDCIWNTIPLDLNTVPWSKMDPIGWQQVKSALNDAHGQVRSRWLSDPFAVTKYVSAAKDVVFISMLYHLLDHFITYLEIRPWTMLEKMYRLFTPFLSTPTEATLDRFMKCPTDAFEAFSKIVDLSDHMLYSKVLEYMNDAKRKNRTEFLNFTTRVLALELENYLKRFGLSDRHVYIDMTKNAVKNIPYASEMECRQFFNRVLQTSVHIIPSNLNIVNWFSMSENDMWSLDS